MARFQVRARTVDMLGRQQIAGIPTAISELFKNAHDAYAKNVEVDYFRDDGLFVLRDDGMGMTLEEFEQRWLTLGTESKLSSAGLNPPPRDPSQPSRPILGEKGIGRLAIAIIGSQVLVLSRAKVKGKPSRKVVASYIHWGIFELPGLNLEDIVIPTREFTTNALPNEDDVKSLVEQSIQNLELLAPDTDKKKVAKILKEMSSFNVDPMECSEYLGDPSLVKNGCGTHFYILPADQIINDDIDARRSNSNATRFEKNLIGFTNTMSPKATPPVIIGRFRDHRHEGEATELIGDTAFFTPEEFKEVDHHFIGRFDKYGQFQGTVGIYQMEPEDYVLSWNDSKGKPTECGPFNLSFAYMQGTARDSLVPQPEHLRLKNKLDRHGGLYIYRDGIRVQPYGDSDYDWLDIERNRTLGAGYYFYSYRRIFGVIEISRSANSKLMEKAGREGFRENVAYRQLRSILMNFFAQTAADFFREEGKYADPHSEKKEELNRNAEILQKKAKQVTQRRAALRRELSAAFELIDEGRPEEQALGLLESTQAEVDRALAKKGSKQQKALALMRLEKEARADLIGFHKALIVTRPRGVSLSRQLSNEWIAYSDQMSRLQTELFEPSERLLETLVSDAARNAKIPLDDFSRLDSAVMRIADDTRKSIRQIQRDVDAVNKGLGERVRTETRDSYRAVNHLVDEVVSELESLQRSSKSMGSLSDVREDLINRIVQVHETERAKLERLRDQLNEVSGIWDQDGYSSVELVEAMGEELEELQVRQDADLELAQIGLALSTVSHEFDRTVGLLRSGLAKLGAWADANPDLRELYSELHISFDHLDEYLALFTPLDRRMHRTEIKIKGKEILEFLLKLFESRLERHEITLKGTKKFVNFSIQSYPSSIYPPFVNLIDNSIFWLQRNREKPREISLDVEGADILVCDNGPGVSRRDSENIFALNFSRKPGGRGMGLHISRETLAKVGLNLTLDQSSPSTGAVFRISPE